MPLLSQKLEGGFSSSMPFGVVVSSTFLTVTDMHQAVTIQGYMLCEPQAATANTTDHNMLDKLSAKNSLLIIREVKYC